MGTQGKRGEGRGEGGQASVPTTMWRKGRKEGRKEGFALDTAAAAAAAVVGRERRRAAQEGY